MIQQVLSQKNNTHFPGISRDELTCYLNQALDISSITDYCPNGLQVEGRSVIKRIMTGVTACQALLEKAQAQQADGILVHHGYFWKGEAAPVVGIKKKRLAFLLNHDINLWAYHLPLDLHLEWGNNIQLAKQLGIRQTAQFMEKELALGFLGELSEPMSGAAFSENIMRALGREPLHISANRSIKRIAWCTGGAQHLVGLAAEQGVDAYLTGEASESTVHAARELGIHFYAAGHHATERYGVKALGEHLALRFGIEHQFVDIENPV